MLQEPEQFFEINKGRTICLDEIQLLPEIFTSMRSEIDSDRRPGRFLILGSASEELLRQSSETLAGRICYIELTPFLLTEVTNTHSLYDLWNRGGFPDSLTAIDNELSMVWRENYIRTFLERDLPALGININSLKLRKLLQLLAHSQGQLINYSKLATLLEQSSQSCRNHIELLEKTFIARVLLPFEGNVKKRISKSPKVFIRDSGLLHTLLEIEHANKLLTHPVMGNSWEGFVIEQIYAHFPKWRYSFFRTSNGAEVDLIAQKGEYTIAIECKSGKTPKVSKGFYLSCDSLEITDRWVIAPIDTPYPLSGGVMVGSIRDIISHMEKCD